MRILFLLLLFANIAFFAWDRFLRAPVSAEERIRQVQMAPEKIRIAKPPPPSPSERTAAAAPPAAPEIEPGAAPCLQWGKFFGPEAARAEAALAELKLPAAKVQRVLSDANGYWVLIPPHKTRAELDKAMDDLKTLGVTDITVVTEPPQRRNAISLGVFRSEEAAKNLLAGLEKRGVAGAVMEVRERFFRQAVYYIREPGEAAVARLAALRDTLPGTEVKAVACPKPPPPQPNQ